MTEIEKSILTDLMPLVASITQAAAVTAKLANKIAAEPDLRIKHIDNLQKLEKISEEIAQTFVHFMVDTAAEFANQTPSEEIKNAD